MEQKIRSEFVNSLRHELERKFKVGDEKLKDLLCETPQESDRRKDLKTKVQNLKSAEKHVQSYSMGAPGIV